MLLIVKSTHVFHNTFGLSPKLNTINYLPLSCSLPAMTVGVNDDDNNNSIIIIIIFFFYSSIYIKFFSVFSNLIIQLSGIQVVHSRSQI